MDKKSMELFLDSEAQTFCRLADDIWEYAENAFEEIKSADTLCSTLESFGFTIEKNIAGIPTAFCGTYGNGKPVIGLLAEYDALSNLSQKSGQAVKEAVTADGNGHGCGHNLLGAGAVAAAVMVKKYLEENHLPGTIKLFGCPGEEGGSGKAFMAREQAFSDLDLAFTWHPMGMNAMFYASSLANYQVLYKFKGLASHAAVAPEKGRSALDAVELMNVGVNFLREHIVSDARIHYAITNSGGFSPNVVQPEAEVLYLIRAPKSPDVEAIYQRVNKIAQGAALMTETEVEIRFIKACANYIPNKCLTGLLYQNFKEQELPTYTEEELAFTKDITNTFPSKGNSLALYVPDAEQRKKAAAELKDKTMCDLLLPFDENRTFILPGSTDVGDVSWNVPTAQFVTACYAMGTPEHSWQLVAQDKTSIAHKGMLLAAKVMAGAAVDVLNHPEIAELAKAELKDTLDGHSYYSAIPKDVKPQAISKI